jgi:predicted permease
MARVPTGANEERVLTLATQAIRSVHLHGYEYDSTSLVKAGPIVRALGPGKREQELSISSRLAGVAIIVLAIACANVANLLLVRATRRRREIAVRCALGVSRFRLCEQLLTESVLLAVLGGVAAVAFAYWAATALRRLLLPNVQWADGAVDLRALAFVGTAALVVGVIAGLAPAFQATRPDLSNSLKAGARESAYQRSTLRTLLLVAQAALSVVLLVGAGLFVRSLNNVRALDLGYDVEHSVFVRPLFGASSPPKAEIAATIPSVAERLASAPGVEAIAYSAGLPMAFQSFGQLALPDRDSLPRLGDQRMPWYNSVSPGFLRATGVKLLEGREFSAADRAGAPGVLVVSQSMARAYWPGESPIGKCLIIGKRGSPCSTVVGVAADVHGMSVVEAPHRQAPMQYYIPSAQANEYNAPQNIIVRIHSQNIGAFSRVAAQELKRAFPTMVRPRIVAMSQTLEREFRPWRLGAVLFTAFGALALIVAAIGVYSVVAYAVTQRMHEMGVRIALGAGLSDIVGLVTTETFKVVAVGVALGILASLALGRLVASLLYGLSPRDPMVMAAAAVVLCAIGVAASLVPAWRASRVYT